MNPAHAWEVPDGITDGQALALVLQGTTAWHLLRTSAQLRAGESVVVYAAAGGVGTLAVQLAKRFGARRVIGVASTSEKRELARRLGADAVVDSGANDLTAALREANGGARVDVVLEMTGGAVFAQSLARSRRSAGSCTSGRPRGRAPEGRPRTADGDEPGRAGLLSDAPARDRSGSARRFQDMFEAVLAGEFEPVVGGTYPLAEARRAHEDMRTRGTTGKLVLLP